MTPRENAFFQFAKMPINARLSVFFTSFVQMLQVWVSNVPTNQFQNTNFEGTFFPASHGAKAALETFPYHCLCRVDFCGGWESRPTTRVQIRRGWAVPGVSAAAAEPPGASEAVRTRAGLRPGGWRASRAHSPGPGAHCSRAEGGPGWLLPEVGFCRVVLTALTALAH